MAAGDLIICMNKYGNPGTLVAAHPGNTNAVKHGAYSSRLIESRAAEIVAHLTQSFDFTVAQRIAVEQVGSCIAILEAVDRELDERGLVDKRGQARSLLNHRSSISRQLGQWLAKIESPIDRQSAGEQTAVVGRSDYVREYQWIGLGQDTSASARVEPQAVPLGSAAAAERSPLSWGPFQAAARDTTRTPQRRETDTSSESLAACPAPAYCRACTAASDGRRR
jgi:hypothetical protein